MKVDHRTIWVLLAAVPVLAAPFAAQDATAGARMETRDSEARAAARPLVLEGFVLEADGAAAQGAVVVSSAGGKAVTDAAGHYVLEVEVPLDATSLQVTAAGRTGTNQLASARIDVATTSGGAALDPLRLARGATCVPSWLPTFGAQPGVSGQINALAVYDGGDGPELYVGGNFSSAGGAPATGVAKWNGSSWSGVGVPGAFVNALVVFDDGTGPALYAGGNFTEGGGEGNRIARWDGSSWSTLGSGLDEAVYALAVYDDGGGPALYAGGDFLNAGGEPANRIAKWDGVSWSALGDGIGGADFPFVYALAVFDDGSGSALYAGGIFTTAGGVPANHIARWNGSSWSALASGTNGWVRAMAVHDDGGGPDLYVGGMFSSAGGSPASRVARWDGTSWSALGAGVGAQVNALAVYDDGGGPALYVGGGFTMAAHGAPANQIAKWDGSSWSALGSNNLDQLVTSLAVYDDGNGAALFVGGWFTIAGSAGANRIARWDGAGWSSLGNGLTDSVTALAVHDDGDGPALYAAGLFLSAGGVLTNRIARWDGASWSALGAGVGGSVYALASHDDGSGPALYVGGGFNSAGGAPRLRIARWNGTSWSGLGTGMNHNVYALAVYDDGGGPALYAGGEFTSAGGVPASRIAKWNGSSWSALGSGLNSDVEALAVHDDGGGPALYAGGDFWTAGGAPAEGIAKWNGSSWSALGVGLDGPIGARVYALEVHDDGFGPALYAAGNFMEAGGNPANNVARWFGSSWYSLGSGLTGANAEVVSLKTFDDGNGPALYAGGFFTAADGLAANRTARWNGSSWSPLDGGSSMRVRAMEVFDDGSGPALHVGSQGQFFDSGDSYLGKWGCPDTQAPTIFHPTLVGALDRLGSGPGEVVTFVVTATDDKDPAPDVVCVPPSGSLFPPGTTLVECTATDASGNESTAQFPVVVRSKVDQRKP